MIKLAVSGKAQSGKNTVAELIVKYMGLKDNEYKISAFATPMKQVAQIIFPYADARCLYEESELRAEVISKEHNLKDEDGNDLTFRTFLLELGKFGRKYNDRAWIMCIDHDLKQSQDKQLYIISDERFIIEDEYVKRNGFLTIRIKRNDFKKIDDVSETEQDGIPDSSFDFIIDNNSSFEDLELKVESLVKTIISS